MKIDSDELEKISERKRKLEDRKREVIAGVAIASIEVGF
jgi:hypothetical protein